MDSMGKLTLLLSCIEKSVVRHQALDDLLVSPNLLNAPSACTRAALNVFLGWNIWMLASSGGKTIQRMRIGKRVFEEEGSLEVIGTVF